MSLVGSAMGAKRRRTVGLRSQHTTPRPGPLDHPGWRLHRFPLWSECWQDHLSHRREFAKRKVSGLVDTEVFSGWLQHRVKPFYAPITDRRRWWRTTHTGFRKKDALHLRNSS